MSYVYTELAGEFGTFAERSAACYSGYSADTFTASVEWVSKRSNYGGMELDYLTITLTRTEQITLCDSAVFIYSVETADIPTLDNLDGGMNDDEAFNAIDNAVAYLCYVNEILKPRSSYRFPSHAIESVDPATRTVEIVAVTDRAVVVAPSL